MSEGLADPDNDSPQAGDALSALDPLGRGPSAIRQHPCVDRWHLERPDNVVIDD
jgi:hypothetical protein